jgi:hypothetical protein
VAVDGDRLDLEAERADEVADPRPARILERDPVAHAELGLEGPLDGVQRAAGDRHVAADPVGREPRLGDRHELGELRRRTVEPVLGIKLPEHAGDRRQEAGVGVAACQVAHPRRKRARRANPHRRDGRDGCAPAAVGDDEAALAERAVGRGDRGRADLDGGGQIAHSRQPYARGQVAARHGPLDRSPDGGGAGAPRDRL